MKYFLVFFETEAEPGHQDVVEVYATTLADACILAMAQRIEGGLDSKVSFVEDDEGLHNYELECPLCGYAGQ